MPARTGGEDDEIEGGTGRAVLPGWSLPPLVDFELAADAAVRAEVQEGIDEVNRQFAQVEQIKKFTLIGEEWLPDSDMLTPTSKLKRRSIKSKYAAEIEALYG